jgi:hypothetical protein
MDARAFANIKRRIKVAVVACDSDENGIFGETASMAIKAAARLIAKEKGEWISESSVDMLILSKLLNWDIRFNSAEPIEDVDTRVDKLSSIIESIPISYEVYFDLNDLLALSPVEIDIGKDGLYRFALQYEDTVRYPIGTLLTRQIAPANAEREKIACLKINVKGFCDEHDDCITLSAALARFKAFILLATHAGLLSSQTWELRARVNRYVYHPAIFFSELNSAGERTQPVGRRVSTDVSMYMHKLRLLSIKDGEGILRRLNQVAANFEELFSQESPQFSKVRAACEWCFDAMSEESAAMAIVKACIGLETMFGDDNADGGITRSLVDRCSYFLAASYEERVIIGNDLYKLYKLRSKIVHGVQNNLRPDDKVLLHRGRSLLSQSIMKELSFL